MADIFNAEVESCVSVFLKICRPLCLLTFVSMSLIPLIFGYGNWEEILFNFFNPSFFWALNSLFSQENGLSIRSKQILLILVNELGLLVLKKYSYDNFEHRSIFSLLSAFSLVTFQMTPVASYKVITILSIKHIALWYLIDIYFGKIQFSYDPCIFIVIVGFVIVSIANAYYRQLKIQKIEMYKTYLEENNQNMQNLIETLSSGLVILDKDFLPTNINIKARQLLDCRQNNLIDKLQTLIIPNGISIYDNVLQQQQIPINSTVDFGKILLGESHIDVCTSKIKWGQAFAFVILFNDVTSSILLETNKTENECKTLLLRFIPHELRNPIVGMCGFVDETVKCIENEDFSEIKTNLDTIYKLSKMLKLFVYNISDFTEMLSNVCRLRLKPTNIRNKINEVVDLVQSQIKKKKLKLITRIDSYIPEKILTDSQRFVQLMIILLTNSLKYTYRGQIEIIATLVRNNKVKVEILDTGIGIPRERLEVILNHLRSPIRGCLFFGLELADKLALLLGKQELKIRSDEGTRVEFSLQIEDSDNLLNIYNPYPNSELFSTDLCSLDDSHNNSLPSFNIDHSFYDILVVDDSEINRNVLAIIFNSWGYRYLEAHDGKQAIDTIIEWDKKEKPLKIVIMDIEMPVMDGLTATKAINSLFEDQELSYKPFVIGYSAYTDPVFIEESYRLGMVTYLKKPAKAKTILQIIRNLLAY